MEIVDEDPAGNGIPLGRHLGECISVIVVLPQVVMQLDSLEPVIQFADLLAVCVHEGAFAVRFLHDLVYHQLGVTTGVESVAPSSTAIQRLLIRPSYSMTLFEARKWRRIV
jgi:hypothetical protein